MKDTNKEVSLFIGKLFSFNNALKLYHWKVTGKGSYSQHIALDQALDSLGENLDRIAETSYALLENLDIVIPETKTPGGIVEYCQDFYADVQSSRELFEESFTQSILDDVSEAIQQLIYRLCRLE